MTIVLETQGITKQFPGVLANNNIHFDLKEGEIHALLGENGAGKTTLMNVLYGLYRQDGGDILVKGEKCQFNSPSDAIKQGIGMVHQHFMLIPVFTVAENIMLGSETLKGLALDRKAVSKRVRDLSHHYGLDVDPEALVQDLPVGVQQRVEIVKALYRNAEILILDEPTAVLTPQEAEDLFKIMRELTKKGVSIIFITHKLKEVLAVADRITVMRGGEVVGTVTPQDCSENQLASLMVGRDVVLKLDKKQAHPGEAVLTVDNLTVKDQRGIEAVKDVSFEVFTGEVFGIAGVQGNGQTELIEALSGLRNPASGKVVLGGEEATGKSPRILYEIGMGHIPEDRQRHGLVLPYPVKDNLILCTYYREPFAHGMVMDEQAIDENAVQLVKQYDVRTPGIFTHAGNLSGGNQQKVIIARELSRSIQLLIANQPTRGLDVGSIEYIHGQILKRRDDGVGVLLISTELAEILQLADRIAVMFRGKIVAVIPAVEATKEFLGLLMAGVPEEEARSRIGPIESREITERELF
jgi:general nucleoside transport system ATP-binding protein